MPAAEHNRTFVRNMIASRGWMHDIEALARDYVRIYAMNEVLILPRDDSADEPDYDYMSPREHDMAAFGRVIPDECTGLELIEENYPDEVADFSDDELGEYDPDSSVPEIWQESDANPEG